MKQKDGLLIRAKNVYANHWVWIIVLLLFVVHIFFRFAFLQERAQFGWDQVDSAYAAKSILVDKQFFIHGPVAKGNTGIYMGPLYYYLITIVYFFTGLHPIASPLFAGFTSIANAFIVFFVTRKLFGDRVALIALTINTFSLYVMNLDRVQNAIGFIVPVSLLIFYFLYQALTKDVKYLLPLAGVTGFAFHVDFTSIFYPILILLALPFLPRTKKTVMYLLGSAGVFLIFLIPILLSDFSSHTSTSGSLQNLFQTTYHGFHLRRFLQLSHDAFLSFEAVLQFRIFRELVFLVLPLFFFVYYKTETVLKRNKYLLFYLMALWVLVPWIVLSTYRGELTNSYFSLPQNIVIMVISYLGYVLYKRKNILLKSLCVTALAAFAIYNTYLFFLQGKGNFLIQEQYVKSAIATHQVVPFKDHNPEYYWYYVLMHKKGKL